MALPDGGEGKSRIGRDLDEFSDEDPPRESVCPGRRQKAVKDMIGRVQEE